MSGEHVGRRDRSLWSGRERFLGEGSLPHGLRPEIARSWLRSRESGVRPDGHPATRAAEVDPGRRLLRLAQPVLDRLADEVAGADMTVILTDPHGLVLDRRAGSPSLLRGLDRVHLARGHMYSEDTVGTNGIGTAAEDRSAAWVIGSEHYAEWLRWLSCAGMPIRNPITGRVEGILDLTCRLRDTNPLMVPFVKDGAREIERRLYEDASHHDRELLDRFETAARRSRQPVVALNGRVVIANASAARLLDPADHALLWNHVADAIAAGTGLSRVFRLSAGITAAVRCVAFEPGDPDRGAVLQIEVQRDHPPPAPRAQRRRPSPLPGRSLAWQRTWSAVEDQAHANLPVLISGEPGTGKLALAGCLHELSAEGGPLTVLDASLVGVDGAGTWLSDVRDRLLNSAGTLVLRHVDALDGPTGRALMGVLAAVGDGAPGPRVVATLSVREAAVPTGASSVSDAFPVIVHVPPLRERPEDIADILPHLVRIHHGGPGPRCAPDLVQALMRMDWPGNVRQLESLVQGLVARRPAGELTVRDLPAEYRRVPWRRLSPLERVERETILQALALTDGNKVRAAEVLGIGRATLYRKLRELGIADSREIFA